VVTRTNSTRNGLRKFPHPSKVNAGTVIVLCPNFRSLIRSKIYK